jgi:hypothetical protein
VQVTGTLPGWRNRVFTWQWSRIHLDKRKKAIKTRWLGRRSEGNQAEFGVTMARLGVQLVLGIFFALPSTAMAGLVGLKFEGTFSDTNPKVMFGEVVEPGTRYSGSLFYTSELPESHTLESCTDCSVYLQESVSSLVVHFGSLEIRVDNFWIGVFNDEPNMAIPGLHDDIVSFRYSGSSEPPLKSGLFVNGIEHRNSSLNLGLTADTSALENSDLPADPNAGTFFLNALLVSDDVAGNLLFGLVDFPGGLTRFEVISGDYNRDESVDHQDDDLWRSSFGSSSNLMADGNRNGVVDLADYTVWRDALGVSATSQSTAVPHRVPEVSSTFQGVLLLILLLRGGKPCIRHE